MLLDAVVGLPRVLFLAKIALRVALLRGGTFLDSLVPQPGQ